MRLCVAALLLLPLAGCGDDRAPVDRRPPVASTRTLLVTGFGPFAQVTENPSWGAIRDLDGQTVGALLVRTALIDVSYADAPRELQEALDRVKPDLVLCLGVAPGNALRLEATARNRDVVAAPDAAGVTRTGVRIRASGPATIASRLPLARLSTALASEGFEVADSEDAGGYLCNHLFYELMTRRPDGVAGFIHVPTMDPPWDLPRLRRAVRRIIETLGET